MSSLPPACAGARLKDKPCLLVLLWGSFWRVGRPSVAAAVCREGSLQRATAISSGAAQIATITGPALGGLAYAFAPSAAYGLMGAFGFLAAIGIGFVRLSQPAAVRDPAAPDDLFAGVRFVRNNPSILRPFSLDPFAVLLRGATALLPI